MLSCVFMLNSCILFDSSTLGSSSGSGSSSGTDGVTINAGDNYDITINSALQPNISAGAKSVLSTVSIYCNFVRNQYWGSAVIGTENATSGGSGVIYQLDKVTGSAYIITNYHVVYDAYCNTANKISGDISVYLYGKEATKYAIPATYVGGSMNYDLAVLKKSSS